MHHFNLPLHLLSSIPANSCSSPLLGSFGSTGVPNKFFTASSTFGNYKPSLAKLHGPMAWCSTSTSPQSNEFLRIFFPSLVYVTGVQTQGADTAAGPFSANRYQIYYTKTASGSSPQEYVVKNTVTGLPLVSDQYEKLKLQTNEVWVPLRLLLILVIFGCRAIIFLFESSWKNMKITPLCAHAQWWSPWRRKNVEKVHPSPSNLTFLLIAIDRNGFRRMKEEGQIYQNLPQIF